ncbi:MAG: hypothetical protein QOJ65_165 [Fimbriimonadaceae bacterium]|jgi:hypothetical protein|nr:hypothetical protein [Fimbriimonadaceae bacterium]
MAEVAEVWKEALPEIKNSVTGVGVWTALNHAQALALEDGNFFIGMPITMSDLAGHLRMPQTKRLMEQIIGKRIGQQITVRVIDGTATEDLERARRKDVEARRLQEQAMEKMRAEIQARSSWDGIYEQLSRRYAAVSNRSLPQNRARFYEEAVDLVAETRKSQETWDELGERNFARCIERIAQYVDLPSTMVAMQVLQRSGEL